MMLNNPDKFWRRVLKTDSCWEWQGARMPMGYGQLSYDRKHTYAHRVAWVLSFGPIPEGMKVLHRCDNPPCVNPSHLFLGTSHDNSLDAASKGRMARGSRHGQAKLTEGQVREIRSLFDAGTSQAELCRRFGISANPLWSIVHNHTWRHA